MLDVCLLGCGGMMPLPYRWLTSLMARYNGMSLLIDCGEGTQIAMREKGWSPKPIDVICFTHFHADHISGLPGMLLSMGNAERTGPLTLIGPKGLTRVVSALRTIAPELPFEVICKEIEGNTQTFEIGGLSITAFRVSHSIPCYGYSLCVNRAGKFDAQKAKEQGIALEYWNRLQHGETISLPERVLTPQMVMGPARKGLKVTYCTDSRPVDSIWENAMHSDLFVCEGMYGDPEMADHAKANKHMTFYEAAELARKAQVQEMWLTHYSPSLIKPGPYMEAVNAIFANARAGKDGMSVDLCFEDE